MKVSARNAFEGTITAIHPGAVNAEVVVRTGGGDTLVAIVTSSSVQALNLAVGNPVVALVKAPWVIIATSDCGLTFSARNQLAGTVSLLQRGTVNTEVGIRLAGGTEVFAVITNEAATELNLQPGMSATAIIKASHVVLAIPA